MIFLDINLDKQMYPGIQPRLKRDLSFLDLLEL